MLTHPRLLYIRILTILMIRMILTILTILTTLMLMLLLLRAGARRQPLPVVPGLHTPR